MSNNVLLEETFYLGESGFSFSIKTGIDMSNLIDGEIKGVIKRENGSIVSRTIPLNKISDALTGHVFFDIEESDFTEKGSYVIQIMTRDSDAGITRPSHLVKFEVESGIADADKIFV